jgi:hypothetical protein
MAVFNKWRGSTLAAGVLGCGLAALALVLLDSGRLAALRSADRQPGLALARALRLTDPALFTEARYARHLPARPTATRRSRIIPWRWSISPPAP